MAKKTTALAVGDLIARAEAPTVRYRATTPLDRRAILGSIHDQ